MRRLPGNGSDNSMNETLYDNVKTISKYLKKHSNILIETKQQHNAIAFNVINETL